MGKLKISNKKILFFIILFGLLLRTMYYLNFAYYKNIDGYLSIARVLYETKTFGGDWQYYIEGGYDSSFIESRFNNNKNPIVERSGKRIILTAILPIGWPFQIAVIYSIFGKNNIDALLIYNIILSTISIFLFYKITSKLFNPGIGLISSFIAAINPPYITECARTLTDTSFLFFFMLSIYFFILCFESKKIKFFVLFGFFWGITSYIRPIGFIFLFVLLFFVILARKFQIKHIILVCISFILTLSPWIIRNYCVFNSFIPMTTLGGIVFVESNNIETFQNKSGSYARGIVTPLFYNNKDKSEVEINKIAFKQGVEFLQTLSLGDLCMFALHKLHYGFLGNPFTLIKKKNFKWFFINYMLYYFLLIFSTIFFIFFFHKSKKDFPNIFLFNISFLSCLSIFLIQTLIFCGYPRYRAFTFDPILIISSSAAVYYLLKKWRYRIY